MAERISSTPMCSRMGAEAAAGEDEEDHDDDKAVSEAAPTDSVAAAEVEAPMSIAIAASSPTAP